MNAVTTVAPVLQPGSFGELVQFARMAAESDLMPKDYKGKPANIMLAVQMGSEVGLSPMQAIQNIAVINGRPALWGDAMLGLVRRSALCQDVVETCEGDGDSRAAVCTVRRLGASPVTARFSVADAKKAGLWGKPGPWQQYPDRMLRMRARGFALRDAFADVLRGLNSAEELSDIPAHPGPTIEATAETVNAAATAHVLGDSIPALDTPAPAAPPARPDMVARLHKRLASVTSAAEVLEIGDHPSFRAELARQDAPAQDEIKALLADAYGRFQAPASDDADLPQLADKGAP